MDVNRFAVGFGIVTSGVTAGIAVLKSNPFHREQIRFYQTKPQDNRSVSK
jgi:hypothetical protein